MKKSLLSLATALSLTLSSFAATPVFHQWAQRPPMGWNSWDNFGTAITEEQTKAQADFMAEKLKKFGWEYIVVDIQWYEPGAKTHDYRADAVLVMDEFGRLQPAVNRFPSSANGAGFKALASYVHGLGLKFGIHLMRGIPRQAVDKNLAVKGTKYHAQDIANKASICPWNPDMYGVDMSKPGAQDYYNSVFELIASWGVDYVKVDDIARPYHEHEKEIEAIRQAIDRTGRPIVLSLSPGETILDAADHVAQHANLWRISDDFWDRWQALREQFVRLEKWNPHRQIGAWPDADMLPLGVVDLGRRTTRFTPDEQRTLMSLWSIARSPLMHGGDMTKTDDLTLSLLTNAGVLAINQTSTNNRPLFNHDGLIAWTADVPNSKDKYLAVFNTRDPLPLTVANARYVSPRITHDPATAAKVDLDVKGANRLFLTARPAGTAPAAQAFWQAPRLIFADGTQRPLTDFKWLHTDAPWDSTRYRINSSGTLSDLTALAPVLVEYEIPPGAVRFQATVAVDPEAKDTAPDAALEFLVVLATPENHESRPQLPIAVDFKNLGFAGQVRVQDLWAQRDVGDFSGEFSPEIPWHGAGLYRLSPVK